MPKVANSKDVEKAKNRILNLCFRVFAEKGYGSVNTRYLAQELGCSTGTLYHYFKSKEEIFSEMIIYTSKRDIKESKQKIHQGMSKKEKLEILFRFVQSRKNHFKNLIFIITDCSRDKTSFKKEKKILNSCIISYRSSIEEQLGIKSQGISSLILSVLIGHILQSEMGLSNTPISQLSLDNLTNFIRE